MFYIEEIRAPSVLGDFSIPLNAFKRGVHLAVVPRAMQKKVHDVLAGRCSNGRVIRGEKKSSTHISLVEHNFKPLRTPRIV